MPTTSQPRPKNSVAAGRAPRARITAGGCRRSTARSCASSRRSRICTSASARCSLRHPDVLARRWRRCASGRRDGCTRCRGVAGGSTRRRWACPSRAGSMTSEFDLAAHIVALTQPDDRVSHASFEALRSTVLSAPLDRSRPLWQIFLVPRLEDGRVGMVGKIHHALVDGLAALQIVNLILDPEPDVASQPPVAWQPRGRPGRVGWALDAVTRTFADGVGALRAGATAATHPPATVASVPCVTPGASWARPPRKCCHRRRRVRSTCRSARVARSSATTPGATSCGRRAASAARSTTSASPPSRARCERSCSATASGRRPSR